MPAATSQPVSTSRLDPIDAVIYADLYDCAVTEEELWRYSRVAAGPAELRERIARDPALAGLLCERDGLYCLAGREEVLAPRAARRERAARLRRRARVAARALRHAPFVRALLLTGSAAADDAGADADVDLLAVVRDGRLAVAFVLLGGLSRLLGRRPFCPNYYLSEAHLGLDQRDLYVARELAQARTLAGDAGALHAANDWVGSLLPNAASRASDPDALPGGGRLQRLLEWPLRGRLGDALERALRPLALSRLGRHHRLAGSTLPRAIRADFEAGAQLRFHGAHETGVLECYERRRAEIAARLRG